MDSRYHRLGKNTLVVFIGGIGSKIITFLMLPFYTRYLTTEEYGISDMIITYASIYISLMYCCISDAIFIFPKGKNDEEKKSYFTSGIIFSIFCFVIWAGGLFLVSNNIKGSTFTNNIWWIFGLSSSMFLQNYIQQFTRSIDKMKIYSLTGIIQVFATAILAVLLMPVHGLIGYLLSLIFSNIIGFIFAFFASKSWYFISRDSFKRTYLLELLNYSLPLIPNTIMWWLVNGLNRPIMESELGLDAVGIYSIANKIPSVIMVISVIFSNAWSITMLEEFGKPDFNEFFNKTLRFLFILLASITTLIIVNSKVLVSILATEDYFDAWRYIPVLSIGILFQCLSGLIGGIFAAEKKSKYFFYSSLWGASLSLFLTYFFVSKLGIMGASIALSLSFLFMFIIRLFYAWKYINLFDCKYYFTFVLLMCAISYIYIKQMSVLYTTFITIFFFTLMAWTNRNYLSNFRIYRKRIEKE